MDNTIDFYLLLRKIINRPIRKSPHPYDNTKSYCWLIGEDSTYYQTVKYEGKVIAVHRLSYELFNKVKLYNRLACHECDRKHCINPEHIFSGTTSDNMKDAVNKSRVKGISIIKKLKKLSFCGDFGNGY